jgi:hypothetical protein
MTKSRARFVGEIWKEGRAWKIQMPKGIDTRKTKRSAEAVADTLINTGQTVRANYMEMIDYSDTPPEMGMAGDYEDHDAETQNVLKHIVGE